MEKITAFEPTDSDEPSDLPAAVGECIRRIDLVREKITRDQTDIDHLQGETRTILERLRLATSRRVDPCHVEVDPGYEAAASPAGRRHPTSRRDNQRTATRS